MKRLTAFAFLALLCSCGRGDSARGSGGPPDPLAAAVDAYSNHRISADSAARVIVSQMKRAGRPMTVQMDPPLREAVHRELRKRRP